MAEEFDKSWDRYVQLHKDLDVYRGIEINEGNITAINAIISKMQDTYADLYPVILFVKHRANSCAQALTEHTKFMDDLKSTGAEPERTTYKNAAEKVDSDLILH